MDKQKLYNDINKVKKDIFTHRNDSNCNKIVFNKNKEFQEKYPTLFDKIINNELDEDRLKYMVDMIVSIQGGIKKEEDATIEVGQKLFDDFVAPNIDLSKEKKC